LPFVLCVIASIPLLPLNQQFNDKVANTHYHKIKEHQSKE